MLKGSRMRFYSLGGESILSVETSKWETILTVSAAPPLPHVPSHRWGSVRLSDVQVDRLIELLTKHRNENKCLPEQVPGQPEDGKKYLVTRTKAGIILADTTVVGDRLAAHNKALEMARGNPDTTFDVYERIGSETMVKKVSLERKSEGYPTDDDEF